MRRTPVLGGIGLGQLMKRAWEEANEDNIFGSAAELAYYFLLALFPMLIFITSLIGFLPGAQQEVISAVTRAMPGEATKLVRDTLNDIVSHRSGGLISLGLLGTLWAASSGVAALMGTLNVAFDVKEHRSFWKVRLIAIGLTVGLSFLMVGGAALIMFGDKLGAEVASRLGVGVKCADCWAILHYVIGGALLLLAIDLVYHFAPDMKKDWRWVTPGAVFAVIGFAFVSLAFSAYLRFAPSYSATYGALGAVIVLMLWLYLVSLVVLLGGEINNEIAKASAATRMGQGSNREAAA